MKDKILYLLLDIVVKNSDARRLTNEGLDYKAIGELTHSALKEGYLQIDENRKLKLTAKGSLKYELDGKNLKKTDKDMWIRPQTNSRISKIDRNDIFLPNQTELNF